ncbi:hypothetical protein CBF34_10345 [Vagococcus penaei]|uniref:type II toxin-antitoxin system RelB/DinJ family antitoxin n=1 Tax=Vagococcus TaxID=2737 RepID=UPI0009863321|nr:MULTISPECIES: type II toxin-antitoxin system RelB/DinJ family antitoxin [Vagococcus]MBO0436210.1 type II toxin-antitoxin system RelB/DinJ family antitoxin [Vagococcus fluvialis]RST98346.1 hypothetical protein CBF34_10345 [Vagococcus penaei]
MTNSNKNSYICVEVDQKLKQDVEKLFNNLELDMTTAITIFLKQSLRDQGLPFRPSLRK